MILISFLNINSKITAKRVKIDKKALACNECLDMLFSLISIGVSLSVSSANQFYADQRL